MTLKFECEPAEVGSEVTFQGLQAEIEQRALAALDRARQGVSDIATNRALRGRSRDRQSIAILKSGLFDVELYLSTYKDVAASGVDPLQHYIESGDEDGRWPNAFFDPVFYRQQFVAQGRWPFSTLYHYVMKGEAAGLRPCAAFDPERYLNSNEQLDLWIDRPLAHFLWIGRHHGLSSTRRPRLAPDQKVSLSRNHLPSPVSPIGLTRGVNLIGPLDRVVGLGVSARGYFEGVALTGFGPVGARVQTREFGLQSAIAAQSDLPDFIESAAINLVHLNGDVLPLMLRAGGKSLLAGRYNIAVWYWEMPTLRPEWRALMDHFHAFWAPSPFVADALLQLTAKPISLIPPYLSYLGSAPPGPSQGEDAHFVYCFDANSVVERKNPGLLLDAFLHAFPPGSRARLTFKVTYPNRQLPELERIYAACAQDVRIRVIDTLISDAELHRLIASATAYVSPHRSEGLGLTIIEAMAFGTPVIATPFGGVAEFVTPDTAWPIAYRLVELADDFAPYPRGYVWAEPALQSVADSMRAVVADPQEARTRAAAAQAKVLRHFASPHLIDTVRGALLDSAKTVGL